MDADADITTTTGNVLLKANDDALNGDGDDGITMTSGASIQVGNATIQLDTARANGGSITLGHLVTTSSSTSAVDVNSQLSILDGTTSDPTSAANHPDLNISAANGTAVLNALQSIGNANDVDIDVARVIFDSGATIALTDTRGGLVISGPSRASGGGSIAANSPLTISANVTVGASTTFTAGNSNLAGDTLTIDSGAVVTLNSAAQGTLTFEAGDDIVFNTGRIETTGNALHEVVLSADLDHAGVGAADGDRGTITQVGGPVTMVTTGKLTASAADGIDIDSDVDTLVVSNTNSGAVTVDNLGTVTVQSATNVGSIQLTSTGTLTATSVNATGANADVTLEGATGVVATSVTGNRDVTITAVSGNVTSGNVTATTRDLTVTATTGNITVGDMRAGGKAQLTAGGLINSVANDSVADLRAGTTIQLSAGTGISGPLAGQRLELFGGSQVTASSTAGSILLAGLGALTIDSATANNGAIDIRSTGLLTAISVDSSGTDTDANDVTLESTGGNVSVRSVIAGPLNGDVTVTASGSILDGDSVDDLDVSGNDVNLTATNGSIGSHACQHFCGLCHNFRSTNHG